MPGKFLFFPHKCKTLFDRPELPSSVIRFGLQITTGGADPPLIYCTNTTNPMMLCWYFCMSAPVCCWNFISKHVISLWKFKSEGCKKGADYFYLEFNLKINFPQVQYEVIYYSLLCFAWSIFRLKQCLFGSI